MPTQDVYETGCDLIDVTRLRRPDTSWSVVDARGHEHCWYVVAPPTISKGTRVRFSTVGHIELRTSDEQMFDHDCTAIVIGLIRLSGEGPQVDVRWEQSGLSYRYDLCNLVLADPPTAYSPSAKYDTPTLRWVKDGEEYYEDDDEPHEFGHLECRQCGEHITPGYTADTAQQYIPGLRWCRINGQLVDKDEFERRYLQARANGQFHE